jgi:glycosyltransferase involved in cell wall biosynthesis
MERSGEKGRRPLKVAVIGSRGIPGNYGGFETFAERLGLGLVERGHFVNVYCPAASSTTDEKEYKGIRRTIIPNVPLKSLDKLSGSALSCLHAAFSGCDIILFLGVSPAVLAWVPRLTGKKLVINIDGLEWKGEKVGKVWRVVPEILRTCCLRVVPQDHSRFHGPERVRERGIWQGSGVHCLRRRPGHGRRREGAGQIRTEKNGYFLQVCRLEPENNSDLVIREYALVNTDLPLVIVGDAPYSDVYKVRLKEMADSRVLFTGAVYGHEYDVLRGNAFCYIHAHEVGGTNPSLLEALAAGNCVVALDVPYNVEVIDDAGLAFSRERGSLSGVLQDLTDNSGRMEGLRQKAVERIRSYYSWEKIIGAYEELFMELR